MAFRRCNNGGPTRQVNGEDGRAAAQNPDLFLRRHHAARWCGGAARLPRRRGARRPPALPRRTRTLSQGCGRRASVTVACTQEAPLFTEVAGETPRAPHLRQYPRDRRLVEGRKGGGAEDGGADRGGRRACSRRRPSSACRAKAWRCSTARTSRRSKRPSLLKDHLDLTVLIKDSRRRPPARHRVSAAARARSSRPRAISAPSS